VIEHPAVDAEVDLEYDQTAFPDRLAGPCHDAPMEHVFSFDPVRFVGWALLGAQDIYRGSRL